MTAIAAEARLDNSVVSPLRFTGIVLALLLLMGYFVLPFVNQPDLGATTISTLTASRSNNEFGLVINGLPLLLMAAIGALLLGIWNTMVPKASQTIALLLAVTGAVALTYYVIFFRDYLGSEGADYIGSMGIGFWLMLATGVALIAQIFIPRGTTESNYHPRNMLGNQESVLMFGLILLVIVVGIMNPRFLSERNILDVANGHAYIAIAALGMSMVIITGNIDISVGSVIGVLAILSGNLAVNGVPIVIAWLVPLAGGALIGAFIGFLVAHLRIPSIVVTLGMLSIVKGGMVIATNGQRVTDLPEGYFLAQMRPMGIPLPIYLMIVLTVLVALWMRYSDLGRSFYAVGGNAEAARLSGISQRAVVMKAFIIHGVFVGIASTIYATQLSTIQPTPPPGLELVVITSSVVGGVSILGGTGTVIGSTLAAILLNVIRSAMIFINISPFWLQSVQGLLILITVLADLLRRRSQNILGR